MNMLILEVIYFLVMLKIMVQHILIVLRSSGKYIGTLDFDKNDSFTTAKPPCLNKLKFSFLA